MVSPGDINLETVMIPAGAFSMGSDDDRFPADMEGPVRSVSVDDFLVAATAVTNSQFSRFVEDTGWVTGAERDDWAFVFAGLLPDEFPPTRGVVGSEWWRVVEQADWRHPHGPQSSIEDAADHPVVQVDWLDASAFASWVGGRLLVEAEWEKAARGGLDQALYPWGDELMPNGEHRSNIWQGNFPIENSLDDGWLGTSPVKAFPPNGFGLHDCAGNVWEWTAEAWPTRDTHRVVRGGSYLCHDSYCNRYRVGARTSNTPGTAAGNIGLRVAFDQPGPGVSKPA